MGDTFEKKERRGNFSYAHRHPVVYAIREYKIDIIDGVPIVGEHTPLELLVTKQVADFIAFCPYFDELRLKSYVEHDGKQYEAKYKIQKNLYSRGYATLQVVITTNKEFVYEFAEL